MTDKDIQAAQCSPRSPHRVKHQSNSEMADSLVPSGSSNEGAAPDGKPHTPLRTSSAAIDRLLDSLTQYGGIGAGPAAAEDTGPTSLWHAARLGQVAMADMVIKAGCDVNKPAQMDGSTPLFTAACHGHAMIVSILLDAGCDVNTATTDSGRTPLWAAACNGHLEIVNLLIKSGCDTGKTTTDDGRSALWAAACNGYVEIVDLLIKSGCDINKATTDDGRTPLWSASCNGHFDIVNLLIKSGCDINRATTDDGCTPLWIASSKHHDKIVDLLIKSGCDVDKATTDDGRTPLWIACHKGHAQIAEELIKSGCAVNKATTDDGRSPLYTAAEKYHVDVVDLLIKSGCDIKTATTDNGRTPVWIASSEGHDDIVELLIKSGCDPNEATTDNGRTPLWIAACKGHDYVVESLITANCNVNQATTDNGTSPVWIASSEGYVEIVELLINSSCDVNKCTTDDERSPLWIASCNGRTELVELLIKSGCDINKATTDGSTPLGIASSRGHGEVVDLLTQSDVTNAELSGGQTALHLAVERRNLFLIHHLVDKGMDITERCDDGKSALSLARSIPDESQRLSILAALHRKPPPASIMSEDDWYRISTSNGRDILRVMREEKLCDGAPRDYTFRKMKQAQKPKTTSEQQEMQRAYNMSSRPRGHAIIMNIMNYDGLPNKRRKGSEVDVERLKCLFSELGFEVHLWEDCSIDIFKEKLEAEVRDEVHKSCDAFIFVAMGHGTAGGGLQLTDNSLINLSADLVSRFDGENCPALRGKPKIFLFQACRGKGESWPVRATEAVDTEETTDDAHDYRYYPAQSSEVHRKADILNIYSTYEGFAAVRHSGSWFIEEFVFVCELFAHELDILNLITEANRLLRHRKSYWTGNVQTAQFDSSLRKPLYFFPGFYKDTQNEAAATRCVVS